MTASFSGAAHGALLDRLHACDARLYRFIAPAGFGKTTLAWELARRGCASAECDARAVRSAVEVWRRLVTATAALDPAREERIEREAQSLAFSARDEHAAYLHSLAERATLRGVMLVDNAEDLAAAEGGCELLQAFLDGRPSCTILICSRVDLPIVPARAYAPHEVVTVRDDDLRFGTEDVLALLGEIPGAGAAARRIQTWSAGWPLAAAHAAALMREGRALPEYAHDGAPESLVWEIIRGATERVPENLRAVLAAYAAIQDASDDEAFASGPPDARARLRDAMPFLTMRSDGRSTLHPLVREEVLRAYPDLCERVLRESMERARERGDELRCAELALECGSMDDAARALERLGLQAWDVPSTRYVAVLERLDRERLVRHPQLWALLSVFWQNRFHHLAQDAERVLREMPGDAALATRASCVALACYHYSDLGKMEQAQDLLRELEARAAEQGSPRAPMFGPSLFRAYASATNGLEYDEAQFWRDYGEVLGRSNILLAEYLHTEAILWFLRGDRERTLATLQREIDAARNTGFPHHLRVALGKALAYPWILDDRELEQRWKSELGALLRDAAAPKSLATVEARQMLDAFDGVHWVGEARSRPTAWFLNLILATSTDDFAEADMARAHVLDESERLSTLPSGVLVRAAAFFLDRSRTDLLRDACEISARSQFASMHRFAAALQTGGEVRETFGPFVRRYRDLAEHLRTCAFIDVIGASVSRNGVTLHLADRELELLMLLAVAGRPLPATEIMDALWPESEEQASRNALKVLVSRIRARTASKDLIEIVSGDHALSKTAARTNLARAERLLLLCEQGSEAAARAAHTILGKPVSDRYRRWTWGSQFVSRVAALRLRVESASRSGVTSA